MKNTIKLSTALVLVAGLAASVDAGQQRINPNFIAPGTAGTTTTTTQFDYSYHVKPFAIKKVQPVVLPRPIYRPAPAPHHHHRIKLKPTVNVTYVNKVIPEIRSGYKTRSYRVPYNVVTKKAVTTPVTRFVPQLINKSKVVNRTQLVNRVERYNEVRTVNQLQTYNVQKTIWVPKVITVPKQVNVKTNYLVPRSKVVQQAVTVPTTVNYQQQVNVPVTTNQVRYYDDVKTVYRNKTVNVPYSYTHNKTVRVPQYTKTYQPW